MPVEMPAPSAEGRDMIDVQDRCFHTVGPMSKVGQGVYGEVFRAVDTGTGEAFAIKKLKIAESCDEGVPITTVREVGLLKTLRHPNIVHFHGAQLRDCTRLYLVMEFIDGNLQDLLESRGKQDAPFTVAQASGVAQQLLSALAYCQLKKVIHRDVKPANVLVTAEGVAKLCDFGLGRYCEAPLTNDQKLTRDVVTLWYRAPELLLGCCNYTAAVDVWSLGCLYSELITLVPLFKGDCEFGQIITVFQTMGTPTSHTWPAYASMPFHSKAFPQWKSLSLAKVHGVEDNPDVVRLLEGLLTVNPLERLTAKNALRHPALRKVEPLTIAQP